MVYKNSVKSTVTAKWLEAQGVEKAKRELKGRIWEELVTTDSAQDVIRIRKNTKNGEL